MKTSGGWLLCSFALGQSACGSAAAYNYDLPAPVEVDEPTLATVQGETINAPPSADPERYRVALVWFPISPGEGKVQYISNPKYHLGWKLFEIELAGVPPVGSVEGVDMMRYAQAEVVFYEDRNGNRAFDVVGLGQEPIDRVIGRADGARIWWLGDGSMPASTSQRGYRPIAPGWSFTYGPITEEPEADDCTPDPMGGTYKPVCSRVLKEPAKDVSPDHPLVINVTADPKLQAYACAGYWGTTPEKSDEWPDTTPGWNSPEVRRKICNPETCNCKGAGCPLDLPVAGRNVEFQWNQDRSIYTWKDCEPDPKLCGTVFCHEGRGARQLNAPPPPGWPDGTN